MCRVVYLDESGDLGFNFAQPYRRGGSSRFLSIAFITLPEAQGHLPARIIRDSFRAFGFDPKKEYKGSHLTDVQEEDFVQRIAGELRRNKQWSVGLITVQKDRVEQHIQADPNVLYNYMIKLTVPDHIVDNFKANLIRDERSIKVEAKNALPEFLKIHLWFERNARVVLEDIPKSGNSDKGMILIDWLVHILWSYYEDGQTHCKHHLDKYLKEKRLFFKNE